MFEYDPHTTVNDMRIDNVKVRKPMPAKQELLQRNSFPSVNDNKHLTAWLNQRAKK